MYNTTGNPTTGDQVYNAFDHINMETFEGDETFLGMIENSDNSRTVTVLISGLQRGITYYFRGYMQFADGTPTIYTDTETFTAPTGKR